MNKLISLVALSAALLSVSGQAYSKELMICSRLQDAKHVQCQLEKKQETFLLFSLIKNGWKIVGTTPSSFHNVQGYDILKSEIIYLVK